MHVREEPEHINSQLNTFVMYRDLDQVKINSRLPRGYLIAIMLL